MCPKKVINIQVFCKRNFSDGFVCLFASQVLYNHLYYMGNRGMLLTIVGDDRVNKIVVDIWVNILNASELNTDCSHSQRLFFTNKALVPN